MGVEEGTGVGVDDLTGVGVDEAPAVGTDDGTAVGVDDGAGVGVAPVLDTPTETNAVPIGVVPPCWKTRTFRVCAPFATVVEFQVKFPLPESTAVPSTIS